MAYTDTDWRVKLLNSAYDFTSTAEWGVDIEETLAQPATASMTLQDRGPGGAYDFASLEPGGIGFTLNNIDVVISIEGQAIPLFNGKILHDSVDLPEKFPWRRHKVTCVDWQREIFDRRHIAPGGDIWSGPDQDGNFVPTSLLQLLGLGGTDAGTVQTLFDTGFGAAGVPAYVGSIDSTTFVNEYTNIPEPFQGETASVRGVMEWAAGHVSANLQYWLDPALRLHWQIIPRWFEQEGPAFFSALMLPTTPFPSETAPMDIDNDSPNGSTSVSARGLKWDFDYSDQFNQAYISGGTGFKYNGGVVDKAGTGWVVFGAESAPVRQLPQAMINDGGSVDTASKIAAANRATNAVANGILRGSCTVGNERFHPDGWHVGQLVKITDQRMPGYLSGRYYTIQRVRTKLIPGRNWRVYELEWGDAPVARGSSRRPLALEDDDIRGPGRLYDITGRDMNPLPGSTVTIVGQLVDDKGDPRRVYGQVVHLVLHTWDETGAPVAGSGSISPTDVTTDIMGAFFTDMTVGTELGYRYRVDVAGL